MDFREAKNQNSPILVTGAAGNVGFFLVRRLSESGQRVRALVRNPDRAASLRSLPCIEFHIGDLALPGSLLGKQFSISRYLPITYGSIFLAAAIAPNAIAPSTPALPPSAGGTMYSSMPSSISGAAI